MNQYLKPVKRKLVNKDQVISHCEELCKSLNTVFEWNPNPEKNPHAVGGTFEWNEAHGKDPTDWTSVIVDPPECFPSLEIFILAACYEIEKFKMYKRIKMPIGSDELYLVETCDYAKGLYLWYNAIKLAKVEFGLELTMDMGSYINALMIGGSLSENQFRYNQRDVARFS